MRIVYQSFGGRYSDNPRALYERLRSQGGIEHLWLADADRRHGFPPGVSTVPLASQDGVDALEAADLVVANTHTEVEWKKRPDTTYLQTWHGTPLKRIHYDVLWAPPGRLDWLDQDVARWDLLISPNAASTPRLRQAFGYHGAVMESGYPRNDVLNAPDRDKLRASTRQTLGLADHETAVLYAPTWRDDDYYREGSPAVAWDVDLALLEKRLPPSHRLMVRAHVLLTGRTRPTESQSVLDVSFYPDVQDLYLAADVLVTDYSSVMFDFAVTGKPIVFHAYDLERFATAVRGFYFDLLAQAPGPVTRTDSELVEALADTSSWRATYAQRYSEFQAVYCHLEDGHATDRVLEKLNR